MTFALVFAAALLGGVVLLVQQQPPADPQAATETGQQKLFGFEENQVQAIALKTPLRSLKFEKDKNSKWQMLEPEKVPASEASIIFLINLLSTARSERSFTAPVGDRQAYGLHQPLATIDITLTDQKKHQLILGTYDFNRSFLYAQADPSPDANADLKVLLLPPTFEPAVSRPLADWKQPPSSPSPSPKSESPASSPSPETSPSPSPETSPSPSPEAEASPAPSPEPSPAPSPTTSPSPTPAASPPPASPTPPSPSPTPTSSP